MKCYHLFIYFNVRSKVLCNVWFAYLYKSHDYEGQCYEILRDLPSVCAKMLGVAVVKADCFGVGAKFLYLHSIWYKQNIVNWVFSDRIHKVKSCFIAVQAGFVTAFSEYNWHLVILATHLHYFWKDFWYLCFNYHYHF